MTPSVFRKRAVDEPKRASQPRKMKSTIWKIVLRTAAVFVASVGIFATGLAFSASLRDWAATKALSDPIVSERLGAVPTRTEPGPVEKVMVRMRDGVELSTQVFLPKGEGPWPVIIVRDPYSFAQYVSCKVFVRYGYACVYQEVRGRGPSQGTWYPFINERKDGVDLIAWVLRQTWQNGNLALQGGSYVGVVQWAVAGDLPPEVKTFVPTVAHGDVYDLAYHNGLFNEGIAGQWLQSQGLPIISLLTASKRWRTTIAGHFPAQGVDQSEFRLGWDAYKDYLGHPDKDDAYWQSPEYTAIRNAHRKVKVPVMMIGYANDFFLPGMLRTYEELPTRDRSVLMIGPGNHGGRPDPEVEGTYTQDYADTLAWFDHYLRGAPLPERLRPGVHVFVHGDNGWHHFDRWPVAGQSQILHLGRLSDSYKCDGGVLSTEAPPTEIGAEYTYDPRHPVPTRGGAFELLSDAVEDQRDDLCARADVLSFASEALKTDSLLNGKIRIKLRVASDAGDTAFSVKLSEHFADGRVYNIRDDISSLSMRNGAQHRIAYAPGEQVEVVFDLTPIMWHLRKGSRLRLDVSSSSAPAFFPHPNRTELWSQVEDPAIARQTVFGGSVELPLDVAIPAAR